MEEITVSLKDRNWGWAYSTQPVRTRTGLTIEEPEVPDYTGTVAQIHRNITEDRTYNSLGGACHCDRWFYDGKPVQAVEWLFQDDPDAEPGGPSHWGFTSDLRFFDPSDFGFLGESFKIKI